MRELSLHILDLVTNSIEADSTRVIIAIQESVKSNSLKITIRDNGKGMSKEMVENVLDPFMTTRTTRSVGMGLSLMKQSANQYSGPGFQSWWHIPDCFGPKSQFYFDILASND